MLSTSVPQTGNRLKDECMVAKPCVWHALAQTHDAIRRNMEQSWVAILRSIELSLFLACGIGLSMPMMCVCVDAMACVKCVVSRRVPLGC